MITAKLSRKFYDTFGDDIANELVTWFNDVDTTYRADLRELNELNFARVDAKLEQRMAELRSSVAERLAELESRLTWRMFAFLVPTALAPIRTRSPARRLFQRGGGAPFVPRSSASQVLRSRAAAP